MAHNLFEMKHNQNKYAQLVESQMTPEPRLEAAEAADLVGGGASSVQPREDVERGPQAAASQAEQQQQQQRQQAPKTEQPRQPLQQSMEGRKPSQCCSSSTDQISTSFVSTASSQQWSLPALAASAIGGSIPAGLDLSCATTTTSEEAPPKKPARSISRSMLELDQAAQLGAFTISWQDLSFSYKTNWLARHAGRSLARQRQQLQVLRNISGCLHSNQLVAVIGPSGCGKTTLLQFLAGHDPGLEQRHRFRICGLDEPKVAFIGQHDCLLPGLTARETLVYASRLQNRRPHFDHQAHVEPILGGLGLRECADRSVTKLSGGQAKRVTIGQELLYPTNLLVLDEVTSGLDASTSYSIVRLLKRLVQDRHYPMSIVMSIHQPSAKLFSVFDHVYLMSEGQCLYEGSAQVEEINHHLSRFGLQCPKFNNIADYLIEIASDDLDDPLIREHMAQYQRKQRSLMDVSQQQHPPASNNHHKLEADETRLSLLTAGGSHSLYGAVERARRKRERPIYHQLVVHLQRSLLRIRRSHILTYLQLITYILLGLQLATFYGHDIGTLSGCPSLPMSFVSFVFASNGGDKSDDAQSLEMRRIQENVNFLLVAIMTATFAALEITVITFPLEAKTVKREWRNGWYQVTSYFMGRTLADLPFQLAFVIIFSALVYTMTGQLGFWSWRFLSFVTIMVMVALVAQSVGFIFGALFMDNLPAAVFTAPLCIFPALLFSGFFSRVSQVPSFYKPLTFLSHFRYAFDALLVTLYGFDRCQCDQSLLAAYHGSLQNQTATIKDTFRSLFGSVDCTPSSTPNPAENSIEEGSGDPLQPMTPLQLLLSGNKTTADHSQTTLLPTSTNHLMMMANTVKPLEDALVDSVFEHMSSNGTGGEGEYKGDAMDRLVDKFSSRVTTMLNTQANFGHPTPTNCNEFNSYLMTEFDLHNNDLIFGLAMLFIFVIVTRILCNMILSFTMARRSR